MFGQKLVFEIIIDEGGNRLIFLLDRELGSPFGKAGLAKLHDFQASHTNQGKQGHRKQGHRHQ